MQKLVELCAKGGFNLAKFMSNNREVLAAVPVEMRADPTFDFTLHQLPVDRTLGVRWHIESDTFGFKVVNLDKGDSMREFWKQSAQYLTL